MDLAKSQGEDVPLRQALEIAHAKRATVAAARDEANAELARLDAKIDAIEKALAPQSDSLAKLKHGRGRSAGTSNQPAGKLKWPTGVVHDAIVSYMREHKIPVTTTQELYKQLKGLPSFRQFRPMLLRQIGGSVKRSKHKGILRRDGDRIFCKL